MKLRKAQKVQDLLPDIPITSVYYNSVKTPLNELYTAVQMERQKCHERLEKGRKKLKKLIILLVLTCSLLGVLLSIAK